MDSTVADFPSLALKQMADTYKKNVIVNQSDFVLIIGTSGISWEFEPKIFG